MHPLVHDTQGGHSPGKPAKPGIVREFKSGQGKVRGKKEKSGKMCSCMGPLTAHIVLDTKCARKEFFTRYSEEHSCHSYDNIYEYCSEE